MSVCKSVFVSACVSVYVSVSVSVISITQNQITAETSNLVFYICIMYKCYLKLFIKTDKNSVYRGRQKNYNTLRPMDEISR